MKLLFITIVWVVLSGCSTQPYVVKQPVEYDNSTASEIYVVSHGWHTGFIIPSGDIYSEIPELEARFGDIRYIEFGWGDEGFYQAKEITSGLTLRAIFWPTESVVHAVAVPSRVYESFPNSEIERIYLTRSDLDSLVSFISSSIYKDENGKVLELKNGIYNDSQFYKGVGHYHLMNTCNKWTAKGLKSAGMNISPTFKLTADSIMKFLRQRELSSNKSN